MKKIGLGIVASTTALYLQAADRPNIGDVLKEVTPPKIEKKKELLPPLEQTKEFETSYKDGQKVEVKKFLISGANNMNNAELKNIVKPYEEKMLSFKQMQEIANLITEAYKTKGYFVAHAYIPMQNLQKQNGVLKITVIEGEYGKFILENRSDVQDSILQGHLESIKKSKTISQKSLERGLLLINDTPGVKIVQTQIKPGDEVGSSDFIIGAEATAQYNGYVIADNYGSQYTGKHRVMGGVDINSPFQIGDKLTVSALSSEDMGLLNGRVAYGFPLHQNGLRAELSYSKTTYELGSNYKNLDALGYADSVVANFSYPYIRSNEENLETYLTTSYNKMKDEIQATSTKVEKNTLTATLGAKYSKNAIVFDKQTQSNIDISLTTGKLTFKDEADKQNDENGAKTNGNYSKINIELENRINFLEKYQWKNSLKLQYALGGKNLDGSEDMGIGGSNGVKFYPSGEQSAENGYIYNTELLYSLPTYNGINSTVSFFYDAGRVYMSDNISNEKAKTLQDLGVGYYGSYNDFFLNLQLAYNINNAVTSETNYNSKFLMQGGWVF